jgi:hypothetical protein
LSPGNRELGDGHWFSSLVSSYDGDRIQAEVVASNTVVSFVPRWEYGQPTEHIEALSLAKRAKGKSSWF